MTPERSSRCQKYGREPISLHTPHTPPPPLGVDCDNEFRVTLSRTPSAIQPSEAVSAHFCCSEQLALGPLTRRREAGGGVHAVRADAGRPRPWTDRQVLPPPS